MIIRSIKGDLLFSVDLYFIKMLLTIVIFIDLELHQMDVKTIFLNGELKEEIYLLQAKVFSIEGQEDKMCQLNKVIYGLRQSPRQWYFTFHNVISKYGFVPNMFNPCVYTQVSGDGFVIFSIYFDNILLMQNNLDMVIRMKE